MSVVEIRMLRWMSGMRREDCMRNLRVTVDVVSIEDKKL